MPPKIDRAVGDAPDDPATPVRRTVRLIAIHQPIEIPKPYRRKDRGATAQRLWFMYKYSHRGVDVRLPRFVSRSFGLYERSSPGRLTLDHERVAYMVFEHSVFGNRFAPDDYKFVITFGECLSGINHGSM
jgi:hypothetical protein